MSRLEDARARQKVARQRVRREIDGDPVNSPSHYKVAGIEVRDIQRELSAGLTGIDASDYNNSLKYHLRCFRKGKPIEDLKKCRFHIDALIASLEAQ
jgi:hypothetical protein